MAADREQEILNDQIDKLTQSNDDLYQFAYLAAHELQAPLGSVEGFLSLLKDQYSANLPKDAQDLIDEARDGSERMRSIIHALLTLSRVESQNVCYSPIEVNTAVSNALKNLRPLIEEKEAKIQIGSLPTVIGDETLITLIFQNLVGNALKYCRREPAIRIDATQKSGEWQFSVSDNGIGFDMKYSKKLFDRFHRMHSKAEFPGTGLGLALCKRIVDRHGGRIWAESATGTGTTFHFTIPDKRDDSV